MLMTVDNRKSANNWGAGVKVHTRGFLASQLMEAGEEVDGRQGGGRGRHAQMVGLKHP
jgi:hypothetical protein